MAIDYDHSINFHFTEGPRAAFPLIFEGRTPCSLLDVGCGVGTWLKIALEAGVAEVFGVDGVAVASETFLVENKFFSQQDFTKKWNLGRKFEVALCLEVAEHLAEEHAANLIEAITAHSSEVIFGAACPDQTGQHHVNCQWPAYWQRLFNERGFVCSDSVRWRLWGNSKIEPWYRQNIFLARENRAIAGKEPRIPAVIHPEIYRLMKEANFRANARQFIEGKLPFNCYIKSIPKVIFKKVKNHLK